MPGNRIALLLGLICALIASLLVARTMNIQRRRSAIPKTEVVYAKLTIPARSIISSDQLELKPIPSEAVTGDMARKISDLVGKVTKTEIIKGEPVNLNRVLRQGENVGLSFLIPPGMRAITVAVNEVIGVAGFIKPGERVDVIGTIEPKNSATGSVTWTVLQDVEVLAVAQEMTETARGEKTSSGRTQPKLGTSVTLAVTPYQAQKVFLAEEKGALRLTLRPALKESELTIAPVRENTLIPSSYGGSGSSKPNTRRVEVISGGKIQYIEVY